MDADKVTLGEVEKHFWVVTRGQNPNPGDCLRFVRVGTGYGWTFDPVPRVVVNSELTWSGSEIPASSSGSEVISVDNVRTGDFVLLTSADLPNSLSVRAIAGDGEITLVYQNTDSVAVGAPTFNWAISILILRNP